MDFLATSLAVLRAPKATPRERSEAASVVDLLFPSREPAERLVTELLLAIEACHELGAPDAAPVDVFLRLPPEVLGRAWPALARLARRALDGGDARLPTSVLGVGLRSESTASQVDGEAIARCIALAEHDPDSRFLLRDVVARWMEVHDELPAWLDHFLTIEPAAITSFEWRGLLRVHLQRPTVESWIELAKQASWQGDFSPCSADFGARAVIAGKTLADAHSDLFEGRVERMLARWTRAWAKGEVASEARSVAELRLRASYDRLTQNVYALERARQLVQRDLEALGGATTDA